MRARWRSYRTKTPSSVLAATCCNTASTPLKLGLRQPCAARSAVGAATGVPPGTRLRPAPCAIRPRCFRIQQRMAHVDLATRLPLHLLGAQAAARRLRCVAGGLAAAHAAAEDLLPLERPI